MIFVVVPEGGKGVFRLNKILHSLSDNEMKKGEDISVAANCSVNHSTREMPISVKKLKLGCDGRSFYSYQ